jgi:hypothetical protein
MLLSALQQDPGARHYIPCNAVLQRNVAGVRLLLVYIIVVK